MKQKDLAEGIGNAHTPWKNTHTHTHQNHAFKQGLSTGGGGYLWSVSSYPLIEIVCASLSFSFFKNKKKIVKLRQIRRPRVS